MKVCMPGRRREIGVARTALFGSLSSPATAAPRAPHDWPRLTAEPDRNGWPRLWLRSRLRSVRHRRLGRHLRARYLRTWREATGLDHLLERQNALEHVLVSLLRRMQVPIFHARQQLSQL